MNFKTVTLLFLTLLAGKTHALEFYQLAMLRLDDAAYGQQQTLKQFAEQPVIASFFMPNCRWCEKQHDALKQLESTCPEVKSVMMGLNGNNSDLKRALRRKQNDFPAFVSHHKIISALGNKPPVPMSLIFDKSGELIFYTQGYNSASTLSELLVENNITNCSPVRL